MADLSLLAWIMIAFAAIALNVVFAIAWLRARRRLADAEDQIDALNAALGGHVRFLKVRRG